MASRYRVSDVVRLRASESDNSDCEDDEVVGCLPEVKQRLRLEQSQEDGQQLSDHSDHEVSPFCFSLAISLVLFSNAIM